MIEAKTDDLSGRYALELYAVSDPLNILALSVRQKLGLSFFIPLHCVSS